MYDSFVGVCTGFKLFKLKEKQAITPMLYKLMYVMCERDSTVSVCCSRRASEDTSSPTVS